MQTKGYFQKLYFLKTVFSKTSKNVLKDLDSICIVNYCSNSVIPSECNWGTNKANGV